MIKNLCLLFALLPLALMAQVKPTGYFRYPLDSVQQYISLFNALRDNHFHSGLDLKTQEKEGFAVLACADGYISRIKIQSIGYGKAIYVDHPNGYTTVYGHLQAYHGKIAEWITAHQYQLHQYEFDQVFSNPLLWVKKGDTLGWSGNSGRSTGPHVHFEIRHTKTERPINPLLLGFGLLDTLQPQLHQLHFYIQRNHQLLLAKSMAIDPNKINANANGFTYADTITLPFYDFGIGFEAYDYLTDTSRKYMLYGAAVEVSKKQNNATVPLAAYQYQMTESSFDYMRSINRFIDYPTYAKTGKRIQLGFLANGADYPFYVTHQHRGWVRADTADLLQANLQFFQSQAVDSNKKILPHQGLYTPDYLGITFYIRYAPDSLYNEPQPTYCPYLITPSHLTAQTEHATIQFNPQSLFDTLPLCVSEIPENSKRYSPIIQVHTSETPLKGSYRIGCKPTGFAAKHRNKLCWVKGESNYQKSTWDGDVLVCNPTSFGLFKIVADTVKPRITTNSFRKNRLLSTNLVFYITDNLSGIHTYQGYIDDAWELFEYDAKNDLLCFLQPEKIAPGKHRVKIVVTDNMSNTSVYQKTFIK